MKDLPDFLTRDDLAAALAHLGLARRAIRKIEIYPAGIIVEHVLFAGDVPVIDPATRQPHWTSTVIPVWDTTVNATRGPT